MAAQQAAVNVQNEGGGHHGGGRQLGARIWSGKEGKLLVEQMKELCFPDESLGEKDERWKVLGKSVVCFSSVNINDVFHGKKNSRVS